MRIICLLVLILYSYTNSYAANITVTHKQPNSNDQYIVSLLQKALNHSIHRQYELRSHPEKLIKERMLHEVESGNIDVFWLASNKALEERFLSIKIPLYKGLFGYRVFLIRKDQQYKFNAIQSLTQLAQLKAGLGTFWEDTKILKAANLDVETATKYNNLFPMLEGGRFDYFPRGLHEPWSELKKDGRSELTVENNLMLVYPMPVYFYVARSNQSLADDILNGLWTLIRYGEFDDMFENNPLVINAIEKARPSQRKMFHIPNNNLPPDTPFSDERLWFNPDQEALYNEDE